MRHRSLNTLKGSISNLCCHLIATTSSWKASSQAAPATPSPTTPAKTSSQLDRSYHKSFGDPLIPGPWSLDVFTSKKAVSFQVCAMVRRAPIALYCTVPTSHQHTQELSCNSFYRGVEEIKLQIPVQHSLQTEYSSCFILGSFIESDGYFKI